MTQPVMMFAAGFGTRMGALTAERPKPLIPVAGRALIDHALDLARDISAAPVVANAHYRADMLADHLAPLGVQLSRETPDILETGGGLRAALPLLGASPVITMNTDAIWSGPNPLSLLLQHWNPEIMDALLICVPLERAVGHNGPGDFTRNDDGRISRGGGLVFGGVQMLKTDGLAEIDTPSFSLNRLWDRIQAQGRLFAQIYPGRWCDVGTPEGIPLAERLLRGEDV